MDWKKIAELLRVRNGKEFKSACCVREKSIFSFVCILITLQYCLDIL